MLPQFRRQPPPPESTVMMIAVILAFMPWIILALLISRGVLF